MRSGTDMVVTISEREAGTTESPPKCGIIVNRYIAHDSGMMIMAMHMAASGMMMDTICYSRGISTHSYGFRINYFIPLSTIISVVNICR